MSGEVRMLHSVVSLDYERPPTLPMREYAQAIRERRLIGHLVGSVASAVVSHSHVSVLLVHQP